MARIIDETPQKVLRGQMWWVNIPHDKCNPHAQSGLRPAVVVSNDQGNAHSPSLLVCPLTTQEDKYKFIHPNVMCNGTLSYVQCEQIKVLDKELLGQYIGKVRDVELDYIDRALATALDLSHYLEDLKKMKYRLADANKALEESQNQITELHSRIMKLEAENAKYRNNKDMFELGTHVKGIMSILAKDIQIPSSQPIVPTVQNNMETIDKLSSQPDAQSSKPVQLKESTANMSAIEKFNRRLEKHNQMVKPSTPVTYNYLQPVEKLGRPSARKWDDFTIRNFVRDYNEMSAEDLLRKYDLRSFATASKYYAKFTKHESL